MKEHVAKLLRDAVEGLKADGALPADVDPEIQVNRPKDAAHGDWATNVALVLAKPTGRTPRELAQVIAAALPTGGTIARVEVAGPGFINVFLRAGAQLAVIERVLDAGAAYGRSQVGARRRVQVEFVSANPTGPLHVGHGRGAAYGSAVADLLAAAGFEVAREYYVNDAGRQMDILALSVWLRYLEAVGEPVVFPSNGYRGDYIREIAAGLVGDHGEALRVAWAQVGEGVPADAPEGDKEAHVDALIQRGRALLGEALEDGWAQVFQAALTAILDDIRDDLAGFGVEYDRWFSERSLVAADAVERTLTALFEAGKVYERDGALWFRSTEYGDEKDRVVRRENGQHTYFASDIAYHADKFERGFERLINVWGADHHGYIARVKGAVAALGRDPAALDILLVQFANLYRGGEAVSMSTRAGQFVTLRELREEVGRDAARFFYLMRKSDQHLDFDLDLAKSQEKDNPVYYVQYAHARVCSMFVEGGRRGMTWDRAAGAAARDRLVEPAEEELGAALERFPEVVERAALQAEPHQLTYYLRELANHFHSYYNAHKILVDDPPLRNARLSLSEAVRQVIANGLGLLGVAAPREM